MCPPVAGRWQPMLLALAALMGTAQSALAAKLTPKLTAVPFTSVEIDDEFWSPRIRTNREQTIPHILDMCELEGRVRNMWRAAGRLDGPFEGTRRHDADLFKAIEAASYSLATHPEDALAKRLPRFCLARQARFKVPCCRSENQTVPFLKRGVFLGHVLTVTISMMLGIFGMA